MLESRRGAPMAADLKRRVRALQHSVRSSVHCRFSAEFLRWLAPNRRPGTTNSSDALYADGSKGPGKNSP
jgi:hypothetical protein